MLEMSPNYVYAGGQKRPYTCLQQEFKMEKDPMLQQFEGLKIIGEAIASFLKVLKVRGVVAISKKNFLVLAVVGATIGVLLYGVGRLLK